MHTDKRNRRIELGAESLADALLELANRHELGVQIQSQPETARPVQMVVNLQRQALNSTEDNLCCGERYLS